mmetsp:Transcript_7529/g.8201  ORF Transcript_7529/g.8201 Transcript_7529/m.8201 type:complete len:430 (+) Transcript_7529:80-1369(+)|eukprot:CAMPEP_0195282772 /NCGR_PEP_ID=MMETSP0707-20130614/1526_1 /TAXON_ID=33640 /ORGANISM="Asterionellopsis glacialis, Strain CCMP134" /LENGTH=429 /DNA_ID=CAMNT_0040341811 /DNA_START=55 /DNA_END=1344 /DNA_ORIENTATION=+
MSNPFEMNNRRGSSPPLEMNDQEIIPEEPTMRSVGLMSAQSVGLYGSIGSRPTPSFGSPPLGFSLPGPGLKRDLRQGKGKEICTKEWSGKVAVPKEWKVDNLEQVPEDFPLERTSREIEADGSEVASRISDALRMLSIEAEYDDEKAKAKCRTDDFVSFRIRLFAATEAGQPVVVEVQRRSGSAASFMRSCRAILNAAEGKEAETSKMKGPPSFKKPIGQMKCLEGIAGVQKEQESKAAFEKAVELLRSQELDINVLGMEDLILLTDIDKTSVATARYVSKNIVTEEDYVREVVTRELERNVFPGSDLVSDKMEEKMQMLALKLLTNAFDVTVKDGSLKNATASQEWYSECVIPRLMTQLKTANDSPNAACMAACAMKSLLTCSQDALNHVDELGGAQAFVEARTVGEKVHEKLATEAGECINIIETST